MANYLETARRALAAIAASAETGTTAHESGGAHSDRRVTEVPPVSEWPQSLSELATEIGQGSGDTEGARREVWLGWCEWKAAALNRVFKEQGVTGQPGQITAATVRHGERKR